MAAGRTNKQVAAELGISVKGAEKHVGDILVHTWDLARATGQDETLDPDEVQRIRLAPDFYD